MLVRSDGDGTTLLVMMIKEIRMLTRVLIALQLILAFEAQVELSQRVIAMAAPLWESGRAG